MKQLIRRTAVLALACVLALGLSTSLAPTAGAHTGELLKSKTITVKPSGKKALFQIRRVGDAAYLSMSVKRNGVYKRLNRVKLSHKYTDRSSNPHLEVTQEGATYERNGGQGFVSWDGATDAGDYAEYFGWNIKTGKLELFGTGG
jgi:hypothetical protein